MTSSASNLSDPKYGYDLVCATTQESINATMEEFLSTFDAHVFSACYTYDPKTKQTVLTPLQTIVDTIGGDPFSIPDQSDGTNPMVQALYNKCKFRFAFRATMGLPGGVAPYALPDIVVLDKGSSSVSYHLYCADFAVLDLENNFGDISFRNLSQDPSNPWIFDFAVNLDMRAGDQNAFNNLPVSVRARIKDLDPDSMFSVQQLYLDLNSSGLQTMPTIEGLDPTTDAYIYLTRSFINEYWSNLGTDGIVLGYAVKPVTPDNDVASIVPTDLNIEVSPFLDSSGNQSAQHDLYTLNYLVMANDRPMPPPVTFGWNWVDSTEEADCHGAMAIRRDVFLAFLQGLVNREIASLCIAPNVTLTHSGDDYTITYSYALSAAPTDFAVAVGKADTSGSTPVMTFSYSQSCHDDSEAADHLSSIHGDFNYNVSGSVTLQATTISIALHAVAYFNFNIHEAGINYSIVDGNGLDITQTVTYTLGVTQDGQLAATEASKQEGGAQTLDYGHHGIINTDSIRDYVTNISNALAATVTSLMTGYASDLTDMINNSHAWVFPGGKTFVYKDVKFSSGLDLVTHVTYADPS